MNENLKNYAPEPDPSVWDRIEKTVRIRSIGRLVWPAVVVAAIVVAGVVLLPSDRTEKTVQTPMPDVAKNATNVEETIASTIERQEAVVDVKETTSLPVSQVTVKPSANPSPEVVNTPSAIRSANVVEKIQPSVVQPVRAAAQEAVVAPTQAAATPASRVDENEPELTENSSAVAETGETPVKSVIYNPNEDTILWIPNVFVPGSDDAEINRFRARINHSGDVVTNYRMTVFNRNGNQVFQSNDINAAWDGTYRGREMQQSAYVYVIYYTDKDGIRHQRKGTVTLVR